MIHEHQKDYYYNQINNNITLTRVGLCFGVIRAHVGVLINKNYYHIITIPVLDSLMCCKKNEISHEMCMYVAFMTWVVFVQF